MQVCIGSILKHLLDRFNLMVTLGFFVRSYNQFFGLTFLIFSSFFKWPNIPARSNLRDVVYECFFPHRINLRWDHFSEETTFTPRFDNSINFQAGFTGYPIPHTDQPLATSLSLFHLTTPPQHHLNHKTTTAN